MKDRVFKVLPYVQHYDWGKLGMDGMVGQLAVASQDDSDAKDPIAEAFGHGNDGEATQGIQVDSRTPYAELWMGTHVNGPCRVPGTQQKDNGKEEDEMCMLLKDKLEGRQLSFLLKVLSVRKALSIQAHPDAGLAQQLHANNPTRYPDANHKPEMAIALTPFEMLCGIRPLAEIAFFVASIPSLRALFPSSLLSQLAIYEDHGDSTDEGEDQGKAKGKDEGKDEKSMERLVRALLTHVFTLSSDTLTASLDAIEQQLRREKDLRPWKRVFYQLHADYPNDVGCLFVFFMNIWCLKPGEAVYLGPGQLHAYLNGDCVEIMAPSDNVVRAGLTPKFKDVDTLLGMLVCRPSQRAAFTVSPKLLQPGLTLFQPSSPYFGLYQVHLSPQATLSLPSDVQLSLSIGICIQGRAHVLVESTHVLDLHPGSCFCVCDQPMLAFSNPSLTEDLVLYLAK